MQLDKRKADTIRFKQLFKISGTFQCFLVRAYAHRAKVRDEAKKIKRLVKKIKEYTTKIKEIFLFRLV